MDHGILTISQAQIDIWMGTFWWPYLRIVGLFLADPFFSSRTIPVRLRIAFSILLTVLVAPNVASLPQVAVVSPEGFIIVIRELLIGLSMGFVMRLVFTAMEMAGHIIGLQMGLGFASFYDPQHSANVPIMAQTMSLFMLLVFLAFNGHLMILRALFESFVQLPISATPPAAGGLRVVADYGAVIFRVGILLSLPVLAALLTTNLAIGVMTRAAPQLNVFAIGFPLTLAIGAGALYLSLPFWVPHIDALMGEVTRLYVKILQSYGM